MRIISCLRLNQYVQNYPIAQSSLRSWLKVASKAQWKNFVELRLTYPSADQVGKLTVFNIAGNKYRLITFIDYKYQKIFIRDFLSHADYDKGHWKNDPWNN